MMALKQPRTVFDVVGVVVPGVSFVLSVGVVLASMVGAPVPHIQLEVAAFVATLSAAVLLAELL
jgi:hypothetical protein